MSRRTLGLLAAGLGLLAVSSSAFAAPAIPPARAQAGACGISVATTGIDSPTCGLAPGSACGTVQKGIDRAVEEGVPCVFIQAGVYTQTITLHDRISLNGGFDTNWVLGPRTTAGHEVRIVGVANQVQNQAMTVVLNNLATAPVLRNLVLVGPAAVGLEGINGKSSYVIRALQSNLVLRDVTLLAGAGAAGPNGGNGADAASIARTATRNGGAGGPGDQFITTCNDVDRGAGGPAGTNSCTGLVLPNGGAGGVGGTMDTHCEAFNNNFNARPGTRGLDAAHVFSLFGTGGNPGAVCASGVAGSAGHLQNGARGLGASPTPVLTAGFASTPSAGAGQVGANGGGGGGGGGEGGCDSGTDAFGAGGGGGGAGGCAAIGGGGAGGNGGGSYAILLAASHVDLQDCIITRGNGGTGGRGGSGGRGQQGGLGGAGGVSASNRIAGIGGAGAHGGHGGGGSGGAGGASEAILSCGGVVANNVGVVVSGGAPGAGGAGGVSAPAVQGTAEDDGNDGTAGPAGLFGTTLVVTQTGGACGTITPNAVIPVCDIATCGTVDAGAGPNGFALAFAGLAPNPTGAGGRFQMVLPRAGAARLTLFDSAGRLVRAIADERLDAGPQTVVWDGRAASGRMLPSGLYYARLEFEDQEQVQRVVVIR
jgi:hypothetical protein